MFFVYTLLVSLKCLPRGALLAKIVDLMATLEFTEGQRTLAAMFICQRTATDVNRALLSSLSWHFFFFGPPHLYNSTKISVYVNLNFFNKLCFFLRNKQKARWRPRNLKSASVKNTKCSCLAFIREPFMRSVRRLPSFWLFRYFVNAFQILFHKIKCGRSIGKGENKTTCWINKQRKEKKFQTLGEWTLVSCDI